VKNKEKKIKKLQTLAHSDRWKEEVCDWCVNALDGCQQRTFPPIIEGLKDHQTSRNKAKNCYHKLKSCKSY